MGASLASTEVLDLLTGEQFQLPSLPKAKYNATVGHINSKTLICGGEDDDFNTSDECHSISTSRSSPTLITNMKTKRSRAASVVADNKLWILGGYGSRTLKSTEMIDENGQRTDGPDMPESLFYHAAIQVSDTTTLVLGGYSANNIFSKRTHFYTKGKGWWSGPDLIQGRNRHSVGACTDKMTGKTYIVVTGGWTAQSGYDNSVEILLYPGSHEWVKGKPTTHLAFVHSVEFDPFLF